MKFWFVSVQFSKAMFWVIEIELKLHLFFKLIHFIMRQNILQFFFFTFLILLVFSLSACKKKGCMDPDAYNYNESAKKDDGSCEYPPSSEITFEFTNTFNETTLTSTQFNQLNYTNEFGTVMSLSKLRYQISDFYFYTSATDSVNLNDYHLVDVSNSSSLNFKVPTKILQKKYNALSFVFGFEPSKNISGKYADLNAANWGWPEMLGGGYHSLQIEGNFIKTTTDTLGYAFHCGSETR